MIFSVGGCPTKITTQDLFYYFMNLQNAATPIKVLTDNSNAIKNTHFNGTKDTIFLVHGSGNNGLSALTQIIKNTTFGAKIDINIIAVDWNTIRKRVTQKADLEACGPIAGNLMADFINVLVNHYGLKLSKLTVVGHSLAGHFISGLAATLKDQIQNIVGVDTSSVKRTDAKFVEVSS